MNVCWVGNQSTTKVSFNSYGGAFYVYKDDSSLAKREGYEKENEK